MANYMKACKSINLSFNFADPVTSLTRICGALISYNKTQLKIMDNPWLEILPDDYENHMTEIGQAQVLNKLIHDALDRYLPRSFALLGCSTGNGLEHVKSDLTQRVYAIDINPEYLKKTHEKFGNQMKGLEIIKADILHDELNIGNVDLFFIGLVLEYTQPIMALKKIIRTLSEKGTLFIVIQRNQQTSFVTKTKYKSLEKLAAISHQVKEEEIDAYIQSEAMRRTHREEIELTPNKSFITLSYSKKQGK